jgi:hypothetical protein
LIVSSPAPWLSRATGLSSAVMAKVRVGMVCSPVVA